MYAVNAGRLLCAGVIGYGMYSIWAVPRRLARCVGHRTRNSVSRWIFVCFFSYPTQETVNARAHPGFLVEEERIEHWKQRMVGLSPV